MKTKPMAHQREALARLAGRDEYALFMEQGTGKTWTALADAEQRYVHGEIDALLVIAPNGVHTNWINKELPEHVGVSTVARFWRSGAGKRFTKHVEEVLTQGPELRVLAINVDAMITKAGFDLAYNFCKRHRTMVVVDESTRIKNPDAARTKAIMRLRPLCRFARILTGTPIANSPIDAFSQMEFLRPGLLGTSSYRAFVAEYAELMSPDHPLIRNMAQRNPRISKAQIVARNPDGSPRWKNLDKLQRLLAPHSFRVLKSECLDLPEKIYQQHPFELSPAQQKAYQLMEREQRMELNDEVLAVHALAAGTKLQQITSGFAIPPGGGAPIYISDKNPRLVALLDLLEDVDGSFIVWARFREELRAIAAAFRNAGISFVEYHGGVSKDAREEAKLKFQSREVRAFIGNPQAGGIGLTLTAASTVIYFSNDFNLETRLQSEDRAHRIGTKAPVLYIDLVALDTIDQNIVRALQRKESVAAAIIGGLS